MKSLVVYDSNFGCTQKVAETIAKTLGTKAVSIATAKADDLRGLDLLVLGSPIIGWNATVKMQEFLKSLPAGLLAGTKTTTFDTRVKLFIHGDAKDKLAASLQALGAEIVATPQAFYVAGPQQAPHLLDGELEKAGEWAQMILKQVQNDIRP